MAEANRHINILELWAVERSLLKLEGLVKGRHLAIQSDNTTVVAYLNKQGGTHSPSLCLHTLRLLTWCRERDITLTAVHIPGVANLLADGLSRGQQGPSGTEWILNRYVVQSVFRSIYTPQIDLFASKASHQLPEYCSRSRDPQAHAVDALSLDWTGMTAYAFPPIPMLLRVISKIAREGCRVILVAPFWPRQLWFRPMVDLLAGLPKVLPDRADLLRDQHGAILSIPKVELHLTAWPLSGIAAERRAFLEELRHSSPQVEGTLPSTLTLSVWVPTTGGVKREVFLPLELL